MRSVLIVLLALAMPFAALAAGSISGTVTVAETGIPLATAQVQVVGTTVGAATDLSGHYLINRVPDGMYTLRCTYIGYVTATMDIEVEDGETVVANFGLEEAMITQTPLTYFASRARERETPVAFTNVEKTEITQRLGSRDVPMILNETPSVYASVQGGGAGDSRINIRGFDQRNVAVMINGVPVNDMENGWVYWSNWEVLSDVTSSIQVQRGLSAANLAVPSVGGTMNVLTDAAAMEPGLTYRNEFGSGSFRKQSVIASTGLVDNRFALTVSATRKTALGVVENTWSDMWGYFLGASYFANDDHRFDFFLAGAPQRHGQRLYTQPIEVWDADYARDEGIDAEDSDELGYLYNPHWGYVNSEAGYIREYWNGAIHDPYFDNRLPERENYYNKPQANLNWYWDVNDQFRVTNVLYLSIGHGGGSGTYGSTFKTDHGYMDWDRMIDSNRVDIDANGEYAARGILRNSANDHNWWGWVGKAEYEMNDNVKLSFGLDYRHFKGIHFREIRNLLGADYFVSTSNDNDVTVESTHKRLGDKFAYDFENFVDWAAVFGQAEYSTDQYSTVLAVGFNTVKYRHENHFKVAGEDELDPDAISGYYVKAGANYNVNDMVNVYFNAGYNDKPPIFDAVIDDGAFTINEDPVNEKILNFEIGTGFTGYDRAVQVNANFYYTSWQDRNWTVGYTSANDEDYLYNLEGIDAVHMGFELDFAVQPIREFAMNGMFSIGNWEWGNDVTATFRPDDDPSDVHDVTAYIDGLKVGDAAQTTFGLSGTLYPLNNTYITLNWQYFGDHFANFDPTGRSLDPADYAGGETDPDYIADLAEMKEYSQPWKIPNYSMINLHAGWRVPNNFGLQIDAFANVFNLLDTHYIVEADDRGDHTADAANVLFGLPRTWNAGLQFTF